MGSRMETLPASAPPTSTTEPPLSSILSTSSALGVSLTNCHLKDNHSYCGNAYLPVSKGVIPGSQCKLASRHPPFGASSSALPYFCRRQVLATKSLDESSLHCLWSVEKGRNGVVDGQRLSAELNGYLSFLRQFGASFPAMHGAHFQPISGVANAGVMHRLPVGPFQSVSVHSLAKECSPFVLEVTSESKTKKTDDLCLVNESFPASSNTSSSMQLIAKESAGISGEKQEPSQIDTQESDSNHPLPCDGLSNGCSRTAVSSSEESSNSIDASGPGQICSEHEASLSVLEDIASSSAGCVILDNDSEDDGDDDNDDEDDDNDEDENDEDDVITIPDDDQIESDCKFSSEGKLREPSGPHSPSCAFLSVAGSPLKKLLSDESGYYEGTCSEEDGASWWQVGAGGEMDEEEIDWDNDSGSEVDVDEKLLQSFEDLALSPQVLSDSPRPPAQASTCVASGIASGRSVCSVESLLCNVRRNGLTRNTSSTCRTREHGNTPEFCSPLTSCDDSSRCTFAGNDGSTPSTPNHSEKVSSCQAACSTSKKMSHPTKRVHFPDDAHLVSVHRIYAWSYAYRAARKGPWEQFARDRAHFRRRVEAVAVVLEPCLAAGRAARTEHLLSIVVS